MVWGSPASAKVRVDLPSSKVRFTAQFKGQVHCPIQKSGYKSAQILVQFEEEQGSHVGRLTALAHLMCVVKEVLDNMWGQRGKKMV